ncbi:NAD(P)/FAD-dependent oxidoreductase [Sneathiella aquimaris]|uniref:NAD(P)/FAD-dependent oxidoreductase n=1 Tax=Sneathiella aquimaris TaxID=2599305 RepID=UPI00146E283F|nr:FAD-binding oxidoreductase [Sneathiella aquimaris]
MSSSSKCDVLVVGAGIVGVSTAYLLQHAGLHVTLVDKKGPCAGTSYGNAGAIVDKCSVPNSLPGLWKSVPSMLLDTTGPLTLRWSYLHKIMPWLVRFLAEGRSERVTHNAAALRRLSETAAADWQWISEAAGLSDLVKEVGWLKVYDSEEGFEGTSDARAIMDAHDTDYEILSQSDLYDLEPGLNRIFKHGLFQRSARFLLNPEKMVKGIADAFTKIGGNIVISEIQQITENEQGLVATGQSHKIEAGRLVLCTGAWSKNLAGQFGADIPLDTERGYHLMFQTPNGPTIQRPIVYGEKSFVLAPMEMGVRMTSQVEFAGLEAGPDYRRIRKLVPLAQKMLPSLDGKEQDVWLGYRPSLPDSLPVIGPSPRSNRVTFAFGHQHYGMTLGPTTGRLVRDIVLGNRDSLPLWPYRANRFS